MEIDGVVYTVEETGEFEQDDKYQTAGIVLQMEVSFTALTLREAEVRFHIGNMRIMVMQILMKLKRRK